MLLLLAASVNKNTPPDKKTGWEVGSESTKSGAGSQFLLLGRTAKAHGKGCSFFTDTGSDTGSNPSSTHLSANTDNDARTGSD